VRHLKNGELKTPHLRAPDPSLSLEFLESWEPDGLLPPVIEGTPRPPRILE